VITGCGVGVLVVGLVSTGPWARGTAARTRELLSAEGSAPERPLVPMR
jgi:hypothetical protein